MKLIIGLCLLAVAMVSAVPAEDEGSFKVEDVLANRRLLLPYIKCLIDQGKCTASGKALKDHVADALENDCAKCDEKQKHDIDLVFKHLINKEKDFWTQLVAKYDPPKKYAPSIEKLYLGKE